jgi:asparagine synthase (glutamine-hydrolysing)
VCGIAGLLALNGGVAGDAQRLGRMVATLRHRGPDDRGTFVDGPAALGAARLSIIDVERGHQPISVDGGAITVVQNGEIYNHVELRDELQRSGRHFATECDTEVIAHLYAAEGIGAFQRMRGMFAVAIWDARHQRLVLARDRVGKKPLYVYRRAHELLFGSETKAILRVLPETPAVNADALLQFFTFGYVSGEAAIFDGMRRVPPGTALVVDAGTGSERVERYWQWPEPAEAGGAMAERDAVERLRAELDDAVRIRLRSDVPLGAFLSGGIDSAAVLALMARHSSRPVKTFTIGFGDAHYDELEDARSTAQAMGADHHEQVVTPDCVRVAEMLALHYDEPFADASAIPTFYVAELARKHVTVCLTGDGGDELFAGYTPYADALARVASPAVSAFRTILAAGARQVPAHMRGKGRLTTLSLGPEAWFVWRRTVFPEYLLETVVHPDLVRARRPESTAVDQIRALPGTLLARLQQWDQRHYLPGDILVKVDRATMAHSLEARCPILDHKVIELAAMQPASRHGDRTTTKQLFREVVRPWVPAAVLSRPKRGFGVPLRRWFHEGLIGWAREILLDPRTTQRGWTSSREVAALLRQHQEGSRDHAKRVWALVCLELWARQHVDRAAYAVESQCA